MGLVSDLTGQQIYLDANIFIYAPPRPYVCQTRFM